MIALGQPGTEPECDQVLGQLSDIGTVGHADVEGAVGRDRAIEQRHRFVVGGVDRLVLADDLPHLGQCGVGRDRVQRGLFF